METLILLKFFLKKNTWWASFMLFHTKLHKTNVTNVAIKRYRNLLVGMVIQQASRKSLPHKQNFLPFLSKDLLDITSSYKDTWQHVCSNCYACCPFYLWWNFTFFPGFYALTSLQVLRRSVRNVDKAVYTFTYYYLKCYF